MPGGLYFEQQASGTSASVRSYRDTIRLFLSLLAADRAKNRRGEALIAQYGAGSQAPVIHEITPVTGQQRVSAGTGRDLTAYADGGLTEPRGRGRQPSCPGSPIVLPAYLYPAAASEVIRWPCDQATGEHGGGQGGRQRA